jgi:hypothetical protein
MRSAKAELIVPIRDRRQRRRFLTVKNLRNALLVILAIFAGITIEANLRKPATSDYGRLYGQKMQPTSSMPKKPEIVQEGQINDANSADPTLVTAQARAQILTGESDVPQTQTTAPAPPPPGTLVGHDNTGRLVLVGGPEGVTLVQQKDTRPVLGGGFGKQ